MQNDKTNINIRSIVYYINYNYDNSSFIFHLLVMEVYKKIMGLYEIKVWFKDSTCRKFVVTDYQIKGVGTI